MEHERGKVRTVMRFQSGEALGRVQIADEVVAIIAGLAATEVEGVASMAGNNANELVSKLGMKLSKGIKVSVDNEVAVEVAINIDYGLAFPRPAVWFREKSEASIENMTGLSFPTRECDHRRSVCMEKHD